MVFCSTVIFLLCWLNRLTSASIEGPSPPVNPFQYDRVIGGPSYSPPE
jgi:hypothetical protein